MGRTCRSAFAIAMLSLATGCIESRAMNSWVGHSDADLVSAWGAPARSIELTDGSRVMTWTTSYVMPLTQQNQTCERTFTVSPGGTVTRWSSRGC